MLHPEPAAIDNGIDHMIDNHSDSPVLNENCTSQISDVTGGVAIRPDFQSSARCWSPSAKEALAFVFILNTSLTIAQFVASFFSSSMTLFGDAIHMGFDSLTYAFNWSVGHRIIFKRERQDVLLKVKMILPSLLFSLHKQEIENPVSTTILHSLCLAML